MNWFVLISVGVLLLLLIVFLVRRNLKDEKTFEQQLNDTYHQSKEEEGDIDTEEIMK